MQTHNHAKPSDNFLLIDEEEDGLLKEALRRDFFLRIVLRVKEWVENIRLMWYCLRGSPR